MSFQKKTCNSISVGQSQTSQANNTYVLLLLYFNYIKLTILMYFYLSGIFPAGPLLAMEYFYIAVFTQLKDLNTSSTTDNK